MALIPYFRARDELELLSLSGIVNVIVGGVASVLLYADFGIVGVAVGVGIGVLARVVILSVAFCRRCGLSPVAKYLPTMDDISRVDRLMRTLQRRISVTLAARGQK